MCRYYTSRVFIGTPPQEFALIVDTGSTVTYVPCSSCTHCGPHQAWTNPTTLSFLLFVPFFCCCDHEGMAYMFRCMTSLFVTFITRLLQAYCSLMFLQMLVCCLWFERKLTSFFCEALSCEEALNWCLTFPHLLWAFKQDPRFKPDNSSSYTVIQCNTPDCKTGRCGDNRQCRYERMYAEMSTSSGILGKDQIGFGQYSRLMPQALLFGCETTETGDLYLQRADGIMGLGRGPLSLVDQLVESGEMADSFSLCYGGMEDGGGAMILGAIPPLPDMVFTPSDPTRRFYSHAEWLMSERTEIRQSRHLVLKQYMLLLW